MLVGIAAHSVDKTGLKAYSADEGINFELSGFEQTEGSYINEGYGDSFIYLNGDVSNYNSIDYDVRWYEGLNAEGKVCLQMKDDAGGTLCFEIYTNYGSQTCPVAIVRYPGVVNGNLARVELGDAAAEGNWMHCKVVANNDEIQFQVNDMVIYSGSNDYARTLWRDGGNTYFYTYKTKSEYKNIELSKTQAEKPDPGSDFSFDSNWSESEEDGETIHTAKSTAVMWYVGDDISSFNTMEAEVRYTEPTRGDGGICIQVNYNQGTYLLNLAPNRDPINPVIRVFNTNSTNVSPVVRLEIKDGFGNTTPEDWIKLKLVVDKQAVICYVNDIPAYRTFLDKGDIEWVKAGVNTFCCDADVKNIKLYHQDVNIGELGYVDLEFRDSKAIDVFQATNAALTNVDGCLKADINADNMTLVSPKITTEPGHRYSMKLPLRNTFLVRMANKSDASSMKLSFRTSEGGDEWYEKTFDIIPNSDFSTYYLNVSDTEAAGYLRQFKMEFTGAQSGHILIDAITFEREEPIYGFLGEITSCVADDNKEKVIVNGEVDPAYNGKTVVIWQSDPRNHKEVLDHISVRQLTTATVENGKFTASFPLYVGTQTRLSKNFLASIDRVKVAPAFVIENYQDFNNDAPRFEIAANLTADVTDARYGAVGDGFTDDTEAIQKAIDAVKAAGGGKVIIPGDDSEYGKRYILTHVELCSNLELVIEKGAVLWQSQREEELNKTVPVRQRGFDTVTYGHGVDIDGLVWCTGFSTVNLPMILARNCSNVRITGGGTLRMNDTGGEMDDPLYFVGDPGLAVGQANRVQQIPVCFYSCTHVDFTDITMMRSNGWHCYMRFNNDVYVGNILEKQAVNVTGDGFTITSCKNVTIDRCFTYTSDDAVGICTAYEDKRGQFYRPTKPEEDNATENIIIRHSFLFGGFGISWMPWGAAATNAYYQETRDIEIFDCTLGGHKASGTWPDDPFYGWSATNNYTQTEDKNYCAIKNVRFHDNTYLANFDWTLNNIRLWATNMIVSDNISGTIQSSSVFLNGNFDKEVHKGTGFKDETSWVTGLCYWSHEVGENGHVGTEKIGTKQAYTVDTEEEITQDNYAGYIKGDGKLFEGLYLTNGKYDFSLNVKSVSGDSKIYVRNLETDDVIAEQAIENSGDFTPVSINFEITNRGTYALGVAHSGQEDQMVYIDDAVVEEIIDDSKYDVDGELVIYDFSTDEDAYEVISKYPSGVRIEDGQLVADNSWEHKIMFPSETPLEEFMVSVDIDLTKTDRVNSGLYIFAHDATSSQDMIDAMNVHLEKSGTSYIPRIFKFSKTGGYEGALSSGKAFETDKDVVTLKVVSKNSAVYVFIDDSKTPCISYYLNEKMSGDVGLRSQLMGSYFDNFTIKSPQYKKKSGISEVSADVNQHPRVIYDLSGRRISHPTVTGVYVIDGKKVLVKI